MFMKQWIYWLWGIDTWTFSILYAFEYKNLEQPVVYTPMDGTLDSEQTL